MLIKGRASLDPPEMDSRLKCSTATVQKNWSKSQVGFEKLPGRADVREALSEKDLNSTMLRKRLHFFLNR